jgi:hypothetical protein
LIEAVGPILLLRDRLVAIADFSAPGRNETWAQGRLMLSARARDRAAAPLDARPQLPGGRTYNQEGSVRALMTTLLAGDAGARL